MEAHEAETMPARTINWIVLWIITLIVTGFLSEHVGHNNERSSESMERALIRKRWEKETKDHNLEVERWYLDRDARHAQETQEIERFMQYENELVAKRREMVADYNRQERDLIAKKNEMIIDYKQEQERWAAKMDWYRSQEEALIRRREEMEKTYRRRELAWQDKIGRFEEEWKRKVDAEIRERERARLYWDDIRGDEHCISNGRKKYSARLANLTPSLDGMEACKSTAITLNGVTYDKPISCENTGSPRGIRGNWIADNEGVCASYWEFVKLKDCIAPKSGYRRIEAKLGVVHAGENAEALCLTTPLAINGEMFSHPLACPDWGVHGVWGIWNIPDDSCN
ncbi:hypothetical protein H0H87_001768 [Tephrocybe sp. NHM501043]|nr:hypothetical protein H0H87_001768 [Tephrocybe sp. NHM501043]